MSISGSDSFLENIPLAYYRLDKDEQVAHVNRAWLQLRGYASEDDVRGRLISDLGQMRGDNSVTVREQVIQGAYVKDVVHEFIRPDGMRFWGSIHATPIFDGDGAYDGREGFIIDVTERETHKAIAKTIPVAFFAVDSTNGAERIVYCNKQFAEMFGFGRPEDVIGVAIGDVYVDPAAYEQFLRRVENGSEPYFLNRQKYVRQIGSEKQSDEPFLVEAHTNIVRDDTGKCTRRVGMLRDLRYDEVLQKLATDLGNVLHSFTIALIALEQDIATAKEMIKSVPNMPRFDLDQESVWNNQKPFVTQLEREIEVLLPMIRTPEHALMFTDFQHYPEIIRSIKAQAETFRARTFYDLGTELVGKTTAAKIDDNAPREQLGRVQREMYNVMHVYTLSKLQERLVDVASLDHELSSIRAYLKQETGIRTHDEQEQFKLLDVVQQAMRNLHGFAEAREIEMRLSPKAAQDEIIANDRNILRVVSNVIHNAIKYSWSSQGKRWIDINIYSKGRNVIIEVINFGVPIPKEDIVSGAIFETGYRSRVTKDRGRVGTGFGLSDAKTTLHRYRGAIRLESEPASRGGSVEKGDPFITKAFIVLPRVEGE